MKAYRKNCVNYLDMAINKLIKCDFCNEKISYILYHKGLLNVSIKRLCKGCHKDYMCNNLDLLNPNERT